MTRSDPYTEIHWIHERLEKLEKKVFGKVQIAPSLAKRIAEKPNCKPEKQ